MPSSTKAAQGRKSASWVVERRYSLRFIIDSNPQIAGDTQMAAHDIDELRISLCCPDCGGLAENPEQKAGDPQPQAETERRRQGAVEDCDRARCPTKQDRLCERAM